MVIEPTLQGICWNHRAFKLLFHSTENLQCSYLIVIVINIVNWFHYIITFALHKLFDYFHFRLLTTVLKHFKETFTSCFTAHFQTIRSRHILYHL